MKRHVRLTLALLVATAVAVVAAVGAGAKGTTSSRAAAACGSIARARAKDPNNLLPTLHLDPAQLKSYTGWNHQIFTSAWAHWKPTHKPPYKVAIVWGTVPNAFNQYTINLIQKDLKQSPLIDKNITVTTASSSTAIAEQLQQYEAAVAQKPDLIIFDPISPTTAQSYIEAAGKQGIPTVTVFNPVDTPYAVTITRNTYIDSTQVASEMVKDLNGQGTILEVLGTPTSATAVDEQAQWRTVLANCPGIKIVGPAIGFYSTAVAKTAVLQWLATHPGKIDGVLQTAAMAQGVMQGFQQAGQPVPVIGQIQAEKSVTAYWLQNAAKGYKGAAVIGGATDYSNLISRVMLRMLAGQGPKINMFVWKLVPVTEANLKALASPSWTTDTPGEVEVPKKYWWTKNELDRLFNSPKLTKGTQG